MVTAWPTELMDDYPTFETPESRAGFEYTPAGKGSKGIVDRGDRTYNMVSTDGQAMDMKVHVCDVRKPLLSVAEMNDKGLDVHFYADRNRGAVAINPRNGASVRIQRVNHVVEIEADVLPWDHMGGTRPAGP